MARASAAIVLAFAVCGLLVASAPARRPVDPTQQLPEAVDREVAAEKLLPKPVQVGDAEAADQATAMAVPEEEGPLGEERTQKRSSLLCLVFRCGGDAKPTGTDGFAVARGSSQERQGREGLAQPAVAGTAEEQGPYDSDSDWDSDCDSDDEDEGGIVGWFWRLAGGF